MNGTLVYTVYPKEYAHGFVVLCFVVVMQSFIMNSHEVFFHIHQGCFAGTGAIVRLPQCQWSKPDGYGKISQCITTTKHSKAKTVCIFLGIYCTYSFAVCLPRTLTHVPSKYYTVKQIITPTVKTMVLFYLRLHTMDLLWEKFQWILPLYMKPISFQSKASVVCAVTAAIFIDFCLKKITVFSQHIGKKNNIWIPQNKSTGIDMLINFLC